jgi:integrase
LKDERGRVRIARPAWNGGSGTFELKRDAQRAIDEAARRRVPERASNVGGYVGLWLQTHPRSERTDRTNAGRIRNVLNIELEGLPLAEWDMRELRRRHAAELVANMLIDQGRSPGGARNILRSLSAMAEDAINDELCELNPWLGVKVRDDDRRATKRARELRVWSFDEMHAFAAKAGRYEPMIRALSDCGLRIGEVFALRRAQVDDGMLQVRGTAWEGRVLAGSHEKNHHRDVPVPPGLHALIREMLRASGIDPADLADVAGHSVQTATVRYTHPLRRSFEQIKVVVG